MRSELPPEARVVNGYPGDYHVRLVDLAEQIARQHTDTYPQFLRTFRIVYRHLAATVDGAMAESGMGMYAGMPTPPNVSAFLEKTDEELTGL
jgi:hypothetical protein